MVREAVIFVVACGALAGCRDTRTACARLTGGWSTVDVEAPGQEIPEVRASVVGTRFAFDMRAPVEPSSSGRMTRTSQGAAAVVLPVRAVRDDARVCELEYRERGATVTLAIEFAGPNRVRLQPRGFPFAQVLARE